MLWSKGWIYSDPRPVTKNILDRGEIYGTLAQLCASAGEENLPGIWLAEIVRPIEDRGGIGD